MSTATTEELSTADKARRKAEARRKRILAKSSQRLDVVNGLAPSDTVKSTTSSPTTSKNESTKDDVILETVASQESTDAAAVDTFAAADARMEALTNDSGPSSKGARRMAAMRKRRYKNKSKDKETVVVEDTKKDDEPTTENETTTDEEKPTISIPPESPMSIATEKQTDLFSPLSIATEVCTNDKENDIPSPTNSRSSTPSIIDNNNDNNEPTKKYMGVARMRRLRNAQQKAQRLKEINDADIIGSSPSKNDVNIQRELVAEMATMNATASMIRSGVNLDTPKGCGISLTSLASSKRRGMWWSKLVPPMKVVPRMVTLLLLFMAGLDLGMQPHYSRDAATFPFGGGRDLSAVSSEDAPKLIQHVESSLTKPWEYGLGGKVAYVVGMAPSSPPTALPTSFKFNDDDADIGVGECIPGEVEGTSGECTASPKDKSSVDSDIDNGGKKKRKKKVKVQQIQEDEFDDSLSTKDKSRPKGADYEFDDDDGTTASMKNKVPIIDPLFQVDLDSLLTNANLPLPIEYAAKVAIGFHRMWVYYLWTLPTSAMKSLFTVPKNVFSGWVANPPWILGVVLFIRFVTKIIIGNGKSFTLNSDDNSEGNDGSSSGGGGIGGKNLDVVGKGIDMAKNYVTSKFPKTMLIGGTLMTVMKVDMYVVLCGLLIGLVMPTIKDDYLTWGGAAVIDEEGGTMSSSVLGDGEL